MIENYTAGMRRLARAPSRRNLVKAARAITEGAVSVSRRIADRRRTSYVTSSPARVAGRYLSPLPDRALADAAPKIAALCSHYLKHEFDLLGSGWVRVRHGMSCAGIERHVFPAAPVVSADSEGEWLAGRISDTNLSHSQSIWSLVDPGYVPIDWQLDFKSGYRWSERTWYQDIAWGHAAGADIKVPWELARMHHLTHLGWAFAFAVRSGGDAAIFAREFRDQVLDFITANPPRFGVNWRSAMDVAIRTANLLVAHDIFLAYGGSFDDAFEDCFSRSVYQHAEHIANNLEGAPHERGNHYLAAVGGLLFAAAYLEASAETDRWLNFAAAALAREIDSQFLDDGGNFEASTSYHRLASEIVVYSTALLVRLSGASRRISKPALDRRHFARIEKMAQFAQGIIKPNGNAVQIGDNDSGRFLKLDPACCQEDGGWIENHLDHRHLLSAAAGLLDCPELTKRAAPFRIDAEVVRMLSGAAAPKLAYADRGRAAEVGDDSILVNARHAQERLVSAHHRTYRFDFPGASLRDNLSLACFPDFGLYAFRSSRMYLSVRCGSVDTRIGAAHAHNDQLAVELNVDGRDVIADPGTFVYSPLPRRRDEYRASTAHFVPRIEGQPEGFGEGMFTLSVPPSARCMYFGSRGFVGSMISRSGHELYRVITIEENRIVISDSCESAPLAAGYKPPRFSPGYGLVVDHFDEASHPGSCLR